MQRVICVWCFCYFLNREENFGKNIVDFESYLMYYQDRKENGSRMKITVEGVIDMQIKQERLKEG
mgnify:CR=1 FL=1